MARGTTQVAHIGDSVVTRYEKGYYLYSAENPGTWAQFVQWGTPVPEQGGHASVIDMLVYDELDPVESALPELGEPTPQALEDSNLTITPAEWGATFARTKLAAYQSRANLDELAPKLMAQNRINSIDRVLRRSACGRGSTRPDFTIHIDGSSAMSDLTCATSTDKVTYDFLMYLATQAASMGLEPFKDMGYIVPAHPLLVSDIKSLTEWKSIGYYQDSANLYGSVEKPFTLAGLTFLPTRAGRVYYGAGTTIDTGTTLGAGANRGATTVAVAEMAYCDPGTWVTIGTVETESVNPGDNLEQVLVTARASASGAGNITIRGAGRGNNAGLRFDHLIGESCKQGYNVAAIPVIGKNSMHGVFGSDTGKYGKYFAPEPTDVLQRVREYGWYWFGGVGVLSKKLLLGKVALSGWTVGYN